MIVLLFVVLLVIPVLVSPVAVVLLPQTIVLVIVMATDAPAT